MASKRKQLVAIVGQTASGKSALGMELAQKYDGEIICADSRTIYKGMDIGTAKPSRQDRLLIQHHCLDLIDPSEKFSAAEFKAKANQVINGIHKKRKVPILVGGSGLYVDSVLFNYQFSSSGAERDTQNPRHLKKQDEPLEPRTMRSHTIVIGMSIQKEILDLRIEQRVDSMFKSGLINEVKDLLDGYGEDAPGLNSPGYKPLVSYLKKEITLEEAKSQFIRNDKQLAKRQRTWFKRNKDIVWVQSFDEADKLVHKFLLRDGTIVE